MQQRARLFLASSFLIFTLTGASCHILAQDSESAQTAILVPHVVQYSGVVPQNQGTPVSLRFSLYSAATGGEPVWSEMQSLTPDAKGRYSVLLGGATPGGLPQPVFSNGAARWLGISVDDGEEQPRTVLVATPYSLKASDAETIGGHPASDFKLVAKDANGKPDTATDISQLTDTGGITFTNSGTGPTVGVGLDLTYLSQQAALCCALLTANNTFTGNQTIKGNLTVTGTGVVTNILPGGAVDITKSGSTYTIALDAAQGQAFGNTYWAQLATANLFKGTQTLGALGTATSSTAYNSNALQMTGSAYNSSASAAEAINFVWQAEPTGNDTASPAGTLNLRYSTGGNAPAETGLSIGSNGKINFVSGQTFPGTGTGTITGITTSSPLSGSGTSGSVALSLNTSSLETTLNGVYPQLGAANTFTAANTFAAVTVGGVLSQNISKSGYYGSQFENLGATNGGGVYAQGASTGLAGVSSNSSGTLSTGVYGESSSPSGIGTVGVIPADGASLGGVGLEGYTGTTSTEGTPIIGELLGVGVWADTNQPATALLATADSGDSIIAYNNSTYVNTYLENDYAGGYLLYAVGTKGTCTIDGSGDLACTGTVTQVAKANDRDVRTYTMQTAENWFEDAGSAELSHGSAHVAFDPTVLQIVDANTPYHVFLTPDGDCKGLYIAGKTAEGFDVRELGGGQSSIAFEYRIMAQRKPASPGADNTRLADVAGMDKLHAPNALHHNLPAGARRDASARGALPGLPKQ